jgi:hypothetical protein
MNTRLRAFAIALFNAALAGCPAAMPADSSTPTDAAADARPACITTFAQINCATVCQNFASLCRANCALPNDVCSQNFNPSSCVTDCTNAMMRGMDLGSSGAGCLQQNNTCAGAIECIFRCVPLNDAGSTADAFEADSGISEDSATIEDAFVED